MNIVLLGAPGAGKGTQASYIARRFHLAHIASGDLFRQALAQETDLGKRAKSYMENGLLVPDEMVTEMVLEKWDALKSDSGVVLDGFPRNLTQAEALDGALKSRSEYIGCVIYIRVPRETLMQRLSGRLVCRNCHATYHEISSPPLREGECDNCGGELYQRPDDRPETVEKRLEVYFEETTPLIEYFQETGRLVEIDGMGGIGEVRDRIFTVVEGNCR
ncbi:MAG: adenylate kinase [Dehalococcoidales bacterium]